MAVIVVWLPAETWTPRPADRWTVLRCRAAKDIGGYLSDGCVGCVVADAAALSASLSQSAMESLLAAVPVVLRGTPTQSGAREILAAAGRLTRGRVSLVGFDDLRDDVAHMLTHPCYPGPELAALKACGSRLLASVRGIVVAAAVLARRRTHVSTLASACGISKRSVEYRLARAGMQPARTLLGWSVALHTVWSLDLLHWPLKRCAAAAGFTDAEGLSEYVRRHVGERPRRTCDEGGFAAALLRWQTLFSDV